MGAWPWSMEKICEFVGSMRGNLLKVRVGVVVLDAENRLLLARQNKRPFWVLPGGTLELGESMAACAVREIKEEANLDIWIEKLLYLADFFAPDGRHVIDVVFYGKLMGGTLEPEISENIDEIGFYTRQEVSQMDLKPESIFTQILATWEHGKWPQGQYAGAYTE